MTLGPRSSTGWAGMKVSFAAAACDGCDVFSDRAFAGSAVDLLTRTGFSLSGLGGWYKLVRTVFATQPGDLLLVPVARDLRMILVTRLVHIVVAHT